jgi:hypothetical protein
MGQIALDLPGVAASSDRITTEFWQRVGKFDSRTANLAAVHAARADRDSVEP